MTPTAPAVPNLGQLWTGLKSFLTSTENHLLGGFGVAIDGLAKGDHFTAVLGAAYAAVAHLASSLK